MKKELMNLGLFIFICFIVYILFRKFNYSVEGMTNAEDPINGRAGNAAAYSASLKAASIKKQDAFLISKYHDDYEQTLLNLDDYISNLMLETALNVDQNNPHDSIKKLADLNNAKTSLNSLMKFIDRSH
jgi:hypothetical protein